jgi:hypothetical protein
MDLQPFVGPWRLFRFLDPVQSIRAPLMGDQPVARPLSTHRTKAHNTYIYALSGIRTHDPNVRASEDSSCLTRATVIGRHKL